MLELYNLECTPGQGGRMLFQKILIKVEGILSKYVTISEILIRPTYKTDKSDE
jgi:hypothetical protein